MGPRDVDKLPTSPVTLTASYGKGSLETGDLRMPSCLAEHPLKCRTGITTRPR